METELRENLKQCNQAAETGERDPTTSAGHIFRRVLGDIFHGMRRVPISQSCVIKALYCRCLREAYFIDDEDDLPLVKDAAKMRWPNLTWQEVVDYKTRRARLRLRRYVPAPPVSKARVERVIDFFFQASRELGVCLFLKGWVEKKSELLREIEEGCYSGPPNEEMYVQRLKDDGTPMVDSLGLLLWRCIRGTNDTEMVHSLYSKARSFFKSAGTELCYIGTRIIAHKHNDSVLCNRPGGKQNGHPDTWLTAIVNNETKKVEGKERYTQCPCAIAIQPVGLYCIAPLSERAVLDADEGISDQDRALLRKSLSEDMAFIATQQGIVLPCVGFRYHEERKLYETILNDTLLTMDENRDLVHTVGSMTTNFNKIVVEKNLAQCRESASRTRFSFVLQVGVARFKLHQAAP